MEASHNEKVRVGLVGAGYVSAYHIRALKTLSNVEIVGIADLNQDRARQMAAQHSISVFRSLEEMRGAKPDVIHVLTPPDSHCAVTLEALGMGCHVFIEKPMAPHYRNGSYPFQDLGVHGLCLLEAFLGQIQNADVHPVSTGKDPNLFFDEWFAMVDCARGVGRMYISWNVRLPRNELVIHGTRGIMNVDCYLQSCIVRKTLPVPKVIQMFVAVGTSSLASLTNATRTAFRFATGKLRPNPGIHDSVIEFHRALASGAPVPVPVEEGRRMVYWMEDVSRRADAEKKARLAVSAPVPPARVLVTGGTGGLGKAVVKRLRERGELVRVLAHRPNPAMEEDPRIHLVYGDLGDPLAVERAVKGVDVVCHVGAAMRGRGWADLDRKSV